MIYLNFYKNVPLKNENVDVLIDDNFRTWLDTNYFVVSANLETWFDVIGTDESSYVDVEVDANLIDQCNYMSIDYYENSAKVRTKYFFINRAERVAESTFRLQLSVDYWQSYFRQDRNGIEMPSIKNAIMIQGHDRIVNQECKEMIPANAVNTAPTITSLGTGYYRIVVHFTSNEPGAYNCVVVSNAVYLLTGTTAILDNIQRSPSFITILSGGQTQTINISIVGIYIVPTLLFSDFSFFDGTQAEIYQGGLFSTLQGPNFVFYWIGRKKDGTTNVAKIEKTMTVTPNQHEITIVGTGSSNVELSFNGKSYDIKTVMTIGNDFAILLFADKQIIDITADFEIELVYDEISSYMAQTKNSRELGVLAKTIGVAGSIATSFKNPLGFFGAGVGISSLLMEETKLQDMDSKPAKLQNSTNGLSSLNILGGLGVIRYAPINADVIENFDNYFGYGMNRFIRTLSLSSDTAYNRFKYYKCSELSIVGKFGHDIQQIFENYFKRGIRVWFNCTHYLDSMNPHFNS